MEPHLIYYPLSLTKSDVYQLIYSRAAIKKTCKEHKVAQLKDYALVIGV